MKTNGRQQISEVFIQFSKTKINAFFTGISQIAQDTNGYFSPICIITRVQQRPPNQSRQASTADGGGHATNTIGRRAIDCDYQCSATVVKFEMIVMSHITLLI